MKKNIGFVAVAVALLALTADVAYARGGGHSGRGSYRFHNSGFAPSYSPNSGSSNSSSLRGTSASRSSASRNTSGTSGSGQQTVTPTIPTRTLTTSPSTQTTTSTTPIATLPTTPASNVTTAQSPTITTNPLGITPYVSVPLDPNAAAQRQYGAMLHNAKQLIKAGVYPPAAQYLQRIISGAPGTRIATEAQRLLSSIPV